MKREAHSSSPRSLDRYSEMRDFDRTDEPSGQTAAQSAASLSFPSTGNSFVIQKHAARRLHYDFRLELDGVLLSWAVPKGPSLWTGDKRLAVEVEDHPLDYRDFEGTIPKGQYGGGSVIVWDKGTWTPNADPHEGLKKGRIDFSLDGEKLHGRFMLIRTKGGEAKKPSWLLMKRTDEHAVPKEANGGKSIVELRPESILTGRTIEDIEAGVPAHEEKGKVGRKAKTSSSAAPLPEFGSIAPQLATLVKSVPSGDEWIYEIKFDGYRTLAWLDDGDVKMASRRGLDWTSKYSFIADALSRVRAKNAIFDGEVAYVEKDGRTNFQKLQNTLGVSGTDADRGARLVYFVFDLLFYDGEDLRDQPLSYRKERLRTILAGEKPPLKMSDDVADGKAFFREACRLDLEGIIGKRADQPYVSKRSPDWVKVKCDKRQEMVIVGFTPPSGNRKGIGALLMAVSEKAKSPTKTKEEKLRYTGKVGTGFTNATLSDLSERLAKLEIDEATPSLLNPPKMKGRAHWVEPKLVGEVRFSEFTSDGIMRHPSFQGLRTDKKPGEVHREVEVEAPSHSHSHSHSRAHTSNEVHGIKVSHPERVMDQETGLTKLDLVRYYGDVAEHMLPYIDHRPLMLLRCPGGTQTSAFRQSDRRHGGKKPSCFVQKHQGQGLQRTNIGHAKVKDGGSEEAVFVRSAKEIVTLAQNNTVELHGWGSRLPKWDRPDWIVLDLDPDEALPFATVIDAAFEVRDALKTLSLESWVKTTGGKGVHVVVPISPRRYDWATIKRASHQLALLMTHANPKRYVANMSKKAREGKIFVDYLRNGEGATAALPYSARARAGLTVATPISWADLRSIDPQELTIVSVPKLLTRRQTDPWSDMLNMKQPLPTALLEANL